MASKILSDKPYLGNMDIILTKLNKYTDIIGSQFSADLFYTDSDYRKRATDYYNLIKGTFNVLDILQSVPHFFSMSRSFYYGEKEISNIANKYNFTTKFIPKLLKDGIKSKELDSRDIFRKILFMSRPGNPIDLDESIISKADDFYDDQMILK
jgi:hypothetical protein